MPIRFRCSACNQQLSIATRKAGARTGCPNCKAAVTVPGASVPSESLDEPDEPVEPEAASAFRPILATVCIALFLFGALAVVLAVALHKPTNPGAERAQVDQPAPPATPIPALQPNPPQPPQGKGEPPSSQPVPLAPMTPAPQPDPSASTSQPEGPQLAPAPHFAKPPSQVVLDNFGNPIGSQYGLGQDGAFKGQKLLFWCAFENAGRVFFHSSNPLWKALEAKGFVVRPVFGKFNPAWLKEADQLWILSSGRFELPAGVTPDLLVEAVTLLPPGMVPSGFTVQEYQYIVGATLDVALSPRHQLDDKAYKAIEDFVKAGKGLCLLADDEPFTAEADELAQRLFGARVGGNYLADKVATVRGRGLTPDLLRKFGGQFEVDGHALLTGVNFLFEGITVSHVTKSDKLDVALAASDGQALLAVSKVAGQRVVIDCGFTRYCHGPTARTSYISKTAGTVRLAQNIAAYLAGNDAPKR